MQERLNLLEMAVYKLKTQGEKTKFDEIDDKLVDFQIQLRDVKENLEDKIGNFTNKIEDYVF